MMYRLRLYVYVHVGQMVAKSHQLAVATKIGYDTTFLGQQKWQYTHRYREDILFRTVSSNNLWKKQIV